MEVYHYDEVTGDYLGSSAAQLDPCETPQRWLVPAHSTLIAPPVVKNATIVFNSKTQTWDIEPLRAIVEPEKPKMGLVPPLPEGM